MRGHVCAQHSPPQIGIKGLGLRHTKQAALRRIIMRPHVDAIQFVDIRIKMRIGSPMSRGIPLPLNTTSAVILRLRAWAAANGWTKSRFAAAAGLRDTTLRDFHHDDWNPTREILARLEAVVPSTWQAGDSVVDSNQAASGGASATASAGEAG